MIGQSYLQTTMIQSAVIEENLFLSVLSYREVNTRETHLKRLVLKQSCHGQSSSTLHRNPHHSVHDFPSLTQ